LVDAIANHPSGDLFLRAGSVNAQKVQSQGWNATNPRLQLPCTWAGTVALRCGTQGALYVLNTGLGEAAGVSIYGNGGTSLLRSISLGNYSDGFTVDRSHARD